MEKDLESRVLDLEISREFNGFYWNLGLFLLSLFFFVSNAVANVVLMCVVWAVLGVFNAFGALSRWKRFRTLLAEKDDRK